MPKKVDEIRKAVQGKVKNPWAVAYSTYNKTKRKKRRKTLAEGE